MKCKCGATVNSVDVIHITSTARETLVNHCRKCDRVSYWWHVRTPSESVVLIDYLDRPAGAKQWPPTGYRRRLHKH